MSRDTCTPMFIAALFTIARTWMQPRCPSADEWIRKLWYNRSNCWVCGALPSSSVEGFPWRTSPFQGKDFLQVCEYLRRQSHAMPLLHLMTSINPKIDWCNTLHFNYGHNVTFILILTCFNDYVALHL